jgi:hypothetical protein
VSTLAKFLKAPSHPSFLQQPTTFELVITAATEVIGISIAMSAFGT